MRMRMGCMQKLPSLDEITLGDEMSDSDADSQQSPQKLTDLIGPKQELPSLDEIDFHSEDSDSDSDFEQSPPRLSDLMRHPREERQSRVVLGDENPLVRPQRLRHFRFLSKPGAAARARSTKEVVGVQ